MLFVAKELKESLVVDLLECEERHFVYFLRDNILEELDMIWKRVNSSHILGKHVACGVPNWTQVNHVIKLAIACIITKNREQGR